jgi:hypothetical protein
MKDHTRRTHTLERELGACSAAGELVDSEGSTAELTVLGHFRWLLRRCHQISDGQSGKLWWRDLCGFWGIPQGIVRITKMDRLQHAVA